jgi:hypothetical protein
LPTFAGAWKVLLCTEKLRYEAMQEARKRAMETQEVCRQTSQFISGKWGFPRERLPFLF